ncbi:MAG: ribonuclease PH [Schwartzia sp. (in: firmicutes)]
MKRRDGRAADALRQVKITKYFQRYPAGSVLIEMGHTKVICAASIEERVPVFQRGTGVGWLRAEYALLPSATSTRTAREAARGRQSGRTQEIQRLIGRSLRSVMDLKALGELSVILDCDVIQADGGTRTAAVTGSFVAMVLALDGIIPNDQTFPVKDFLAAVSVGVSADGTPILDLCYEEDSTAIADMNVAMTGSGDFVEIQGTGEGRPFSRAERDALLALAEDGIDRLIAYEKDVLGQALDFRIGAVKGKEKRR